MSQCPWVFLSQRQSVRGVSYGVAEEFSKKIFVHCRLRDDRTAMIIASNRMAEDGWSADRARLEMEKFGFSFAHRNLICPGLSAYEEGFPHKFKTSPGFRNLR